VLKKAALEQSASDAAKPLFLPRAWVWETYERQQTVQSQVSRVLALREHLCDQSSAKPPRRWVLLLAREFGATTKNQWALSTTLACGPPSPRPKQSLVGLGQRLNRYLGGSPDGPRTRFGRLAR
jgi:hypothetical protein